MARIKEYPSIESFDGNADALAIEQTDGASNRTRKVTPAQLKQYMESGDFEATGEIKDGHGNILANMAKVDDLDTLIVTQKFSVNNSTPIAVGAYSYFIIPISKPGYTPVGIVGVGGSGTGKLSLMEFTIAGSNAMIYYMNNTGSALTPSRIDAHILFVKS